MDPAEQQRYGRLMSAVVARAAAFGQRGVPATTAARVIATAVTRAKPHPRYAVGRDAALLLGLSRFLSDRALDALLLRSIAPFYPEATTSSAPPAGSRPATTQADVPSASSAG